MIIARELQASILCAEMNNKSTCPICYNKNVPSAETKRVDRAECRNLALWQWQSSHEYIVAVMTCRLYMYSCTVCTCHTMYHLCLSCYSLMSHHTRKVENTQCTPRIPVLATVQHPIVASSTYGGASLFSQSFSGGCIFLK